MKRFFKRNVLWIGYWLFLALAVMFGASEGPADFTGAAPVGKVALWLIFVGFLAYSLLAHRREAFFKTVGKMNRTWWGRQVGIDLYISVSLSLVVIYLTTDSVLVTALWAAPVLIFANLAILPYLILNYGLVLSGIG